MLDGDNGSEHSTETKVKKEASVSTEKSSQTNNGKTQQIAGDANTAQSDPNNPSDAKSNGHSDPIRDMIDSLKRQNNILSSKIKRYDRQIKRKESKMVELSKELSVMEKHFASRREENMRLKRIKRKLEFRISTEARSLEEEKSLVRQIEEINAKLEEEYKIVRAKRKTEHIKEDIKKYGSAVERIKARITENDARMADIFNSSRPEHALSRARRHGFKKGSDAKVPEINLEDIAVIKKKEK